MALCVLYILCVDTLLFEWCFFFCVRQDSEELKGLLELALTKQKEALLAHWGENMDEEGNIDR